MDPQATWAEMSQHFADGELAEAKERARDLRQWLDQQGFPPQITGQAAFDRLVPRAACTADLER